MTEIKELMRKNDNKEIIRIDLKIKKGERKMKLLKNMPVTATGLRDILGFEFYDTLNTATKIQCMLWYGML